MGEITPQLFDLIGIPWQLLPEHDSDVPDVVERAVRHMTQHGAPFALLIRKGQFAHRPADSPSEAPPRQVALPPNPGDRDVTHDADEVLRTVQSSVAKRDAVIATTGYTGRALYALDDRHNQFYMVGSMGCASSMGLGLAWAQPERKVVVLDGDGAFQMRMGAVAAIGHQRPHNLVHVLLDNGVHDSTGAQHTFSTSIDPVLVARACGYPRALRVGSLKALASVLRQSPEVLTFLHVKTRPRSDRSLPRPHVTPTEVVERFRQWIRQT